MKRSHLSGAPAPEPGARKQLKPWWNERCAASAGGLWLPALADGAYRPQPRRRTWFDDARWERLPEAPALVQQPALVPKPALLPPQPVTVAHRVRLRPSAADAAVLRRWIGCYRALYNCAVAWCSATRTYNYFAARGHLTNRATAPACAAPLPVYARKYAVRDAVAAFATNFAKRRANPSHRFEVGFKTKKTAPKVLKLEAAKMRVSVGESAHAVLHLGDARGERQLSREGIPLDPRAADLVRRTKDPTLHLDALGRFWLHAVTQRRPETQGAAAAPRGGAVALDPGVRTFQTTYSPDPDGGSFKLGDQAAQRVLRLLAHRDACLQRAPGEGRVRRRRRRAKAARLMARVTGLVDELHWKTARFLVQRWSTVYVPTFEVQRMVSGGKLAKDTVRAMHHLRHYTFRQRLKHLGAVFGVRVVEVTEEYTSKTCGNCGRVHRALGSAKVFRCPACGVALDRDGNGARNIFLKSAAS